MGATQITAVQIKSVQRADFDTTTTTKAVIAKVVAGFGITLGSTGVDAGTGDVTINANLSQGISGGQSAIGGTGITDILKLQGTTGNGTSTAAAIQMIVGNNGATTAMTIINSGFVGIGVSPSYNLHVSSATSSVWTTGIINSASTGTSYGLMVQAGTNSSDKTVSFRITGGVEYFTMLGTGAIGHKQTSPTALLHLGAGTATASTAPLKFTSGTVLGTTEAGAMEFDGTHLYFTIANSGTRYQLDQQSGGSTTTTDTDLTISSNVLTLDKTPIALAYGATTTWNRATQNYNTSLTLTGNSTLSITNDVNGNYGTLEVIQNATGGYTLIVTGNFPTIDGTTIAINPNASSTTIITYYLNSAGTYQWTTNYVQQVISQPNVISINTTLPANTTSVFAGILTINSGIILTIGNGAILASI